MTPQSEPPITSQELLELIELQMKARGETWDDVTKSTRMRLAALKAGQTPASTGPSVEARLSVLEAEVKRLRELIEGGLKNG